VSNSKNMGFSRRPENIVKFPLENNVIVLRPEDIILQTEDFYFDIGVFCYSRRASKRKRNGSYYVALDSLIIERKDNIWKIVKAISCLVTARGLRVSSSRDYLYVFKLFMDWSDCNNFHNCLCDVVETQRIYSLWTEYIHENYLQGKISGKTHNRYIEYVRYVLEASGIVDSLKCSIKMIKKKDFKLGVTEPLSENDFSYIVMLSQLVFDGLCDLLLEEKKFPFQLRLPIISEWKDKFLWVFPSTLWRFPPWKWTSKNGGKTRYKAYDYKNGRLFTENEISDCFSGKSIEVRLSKAKKCITKARRSVEDANSDRRNKFRLMLGMIAHNAFLLLFFCNTGANESVVRNIETDGKLDISQLNQKFRAMKFRANGKLISVVTSASFFPSLRRFLSLREYLLGNRVYPYLFFTREFLKDTPPRKISSNPLVSIYLVLKGVCGQALPRMGARKIRASVFDWYQRHHDSAITASVMQSSEDVVRKHYDAGSDETHRIELSLFLDAVAASAKRQRVVSTEEAQGAALFDEGGCCVRPGMPKALAEGVPVEPDCKNGSGCLFCSNRLLIACEEDARKVASAAFVMEQVILGPKHEAALRPLIVKCDGDLEKIADFGDCRAMVELVRKDVFERGNLTPFFADKYQFFLELGVIT